MCAECLSHSERLARRTGMARKIVGFCGSAVVLASSFFGCSQNRPDSSAIAARSIAPISAESASAATPAIPPPPAPFAEVIPPAPAPATVEQAAVTRDSPTWFVRGEDPATSRIIFLPGLCSNAGAYLLAFPEAAKAHGGVLAIDGDKPCGAANSGFHSFTWDPNLQHARVEKALAAAGATAPRDGFTLAGYSAGASIAELMHQKWPELFPRLLLIAPPEDLWVDKLIDAQSVVSMSCSRDVPYRMKDGAKKLTARGVRATYMEMPKCTHGNITEGERIFGEAFAWLDASD